MAKEGKSNVWDMLNSAEMSKMGRSVPQNPNGTPGNVPSSPSGPQISGARISEALPTLPSPSPAPSMMPPAAPAALVPQAAPAPSMMPPAAPAAPVPQAAPAPSMMPPVAPAAPVPQAAPAPSMMPPAAPAAPVPQAAPMPSAAALASTMAPPPNRPSIQNRPPVNYAPFNSAPVNSQPGAVPGMPMMGSAQSNVMSASRFNQSNRPANLERMAATVRSLESDMSGGEFPNLPPPGAAGNDRFMPSPEAIMDSLVVPTDLPRNAVRRRVDGLKSERELDAARSGRFPGAKDDGRRGELGRKMAISLGMLCFFLAGGLLYFYLFSPYGPSQTNTAAQNMSDSLNRDIKTNMCIPPENLENPTVPPEVAGQTVGGVVPSQVNPMTPGIKVHVAGAVNNPGLITLPFDARIDDAIKAAGGFSADANQSSVNLAGYVSDGDQIVVTREGEEPAGGFSVSVDDKRSKKSTARQSAPKAKAPAAQSKSQAAAAVAAAGSENSSAPDSGEKKKGSGKESSSSGEVVFGKVNINSANATELLQLRGVGPQTAEAIVQYRESLPNQAFTSVEQLTNVPGIGDAKLMDMRPQVEL